MLSTIHGCAAVLYYKIGTLQCFIFFFVLYYRKCKCNTLKSIINLKNYNSIRYIILFYSFPNETNETIKYIFVIKNPSSGIWSCPFSIIASKTFPNGCDVIWSIRQWRHWTSIWESGKSAIYLRIGRQFEDWTSIWVLHIYIYIYSKRFIVQNE